MDAIELTREIIGGAIEVHKRLGPGMLESAYEGCLSHELSVRRLRIERQKAVPVVYKDVKLECGYRIDLLVNDVVVVELKSVDALAPIHEAQILTYMRFAKKKIGLLMNFNVPTLRNGLRRSNKNFSRRWLAIVSPIRLRVVPLWISVLLRGSQCP